MRITMDVLSIVIKYLELKEIITKIMALNKTTRNQILSENYLIFKKFLRVFNLNNRMKRSDMAAYVDVFKLIKENIQVESLQEQRRLTPFVYFTDGGVDSNSFNYFMHQLFGEGTHCYSSLNVKPDQASTHL